MSTVVEISNPAKLNKAKKLLGAKTDSETLELALERVIEQFEPKQSNSSDKDLPDDFFEDLFAEETNLSDGESIQAIINEREEETDIDVHSLNRIPPKKSFKITANFKIGSRRKPMKYNFSDFEEENNL